MMKKRIAGILLLAILLSAAVSVSADGFKSNFIQEDFSTVLKDKNKLARERMIEIMKKYDTPSYGFGFSLDQNDKAYAQWECVKGGVNIRIKMENEAGYADVDAYTFEVSAQDANKNTIMLKGKNGAEDGFLYYTGDKTFQAGKSGFTENFSIRSNKKIRYVYFRLIKYHISGETVYIDDDKQPEYYWKVY